MGRRNKYNLPKGMSFNEKSKTYFLITRPNGKKKDISLGKSYAEAIKSYYQRVDYVIEKQSNPTTFEELGHTVLQRKIRIGEIKESTFEDYSRCFCELLETFRGFKIAEITRDAIQLYMDNQLHRATRANHELTLLNIFLNYAEDKCLIDSNPARKVKKIPVPSKGFIPSDTVIQSFKKACPDWLKLYIDLKLKLGIRQADMLRLNASMLDDVGIRIVHGKNQFGMRVRYDDELVEILLKIKELRFGKSAPFKKIGIFLLLLMVLGAALRAFKMLGVRRSTKQFE
ncbi:hypothetical protein [Alteromonas sp. KUL49]|uniref:hypothetical protein n=1 Tax=Alteromonas sp. KUL49 TaxID=2480798 RepID=UPI00102EDA33|nr:hypothetical protein [Alteromonas sp. KUL49]TAP41402.1 hypothetical protein EYS00_04230 [Alteromonas sp. KUL49]